MRKSRWIFWIISLVICCIILFIYGKVSNEIPYDERTPINVCCPKEFQSEVKEVIEKSSKFFETPQRVVFTQNATEAEFIITDTVTKTDRDYEMIGYTPLIVALDREKLKEYAKQEYIEAVNSYYSLCFNKIITDTLQGIYKDKIYCPDLNTKEGELFYNFLLITLNGGVYPNDQQLNVCKEKADEFLKSDNVILTNTEDGIRVRKILHNEIYLIFENIIFSMNNNSYDFVICYPESTVVYKYFCKYQGNNKEQLKNCINNVKFFEYGNRITNIMYDHDFRFLDDDNRFKSNVYYNVSNGFSYIEIPLKEE